MNHKRLPFWMVLFFFSHFGLSLLAASRSSTALAVLGFPLVLAADPARLANYLLANSVIWALVFGIVGIYLLRAPRA